MAKRFFYVCAGLLCLAVAYHLGASGAAAQTSSGNPVVATGGSNGSGYDFAFTANGDIYQRTSPGFASWQWVGNVFGGATPAATQESFGSLKVRYRGEREPQGVNPSTNR